MSPAEIRAISGVQPIDYEAAARLSPHEVAAALRSDAETGLSRAEAAARLATYGPNTLGPADRSRWLEILLRQLRSVLILLLLAATLLSVLVGEWLNAAAIGLSVLISVGFGFVNELGSDRTVSALRKLTALTAEAVRDGQHDEIPAETIVPGDLIVVAEGRLVPADARVIVSRGLVVNEAILTGESVPVEKHAERADGSGADVLLSAGTTATAGSALALVFATGEATALGDIARATARPARQTTPLEARLERLGNRLVAAFLVICLGVAIGGIAAGRHPQTMVELAVSLAIGAVPEGLPAVATAALAVAVRRLAGLEVLVRRLDAVETLGSTTVIVSDKTGTLTENRIAVRSVLLPDGHEVPVRVTLPQAGAVRTTIESDIPRDRAAVMEILLMGALCNDAVVEHDAERGWHAHGDPLEGALMLAALGAGWDALTLEERYPRTETIAFTSAQRIMETVHANGSAQLVALKGALERVAERTGGLPPALRDAVEQRAMAGYRVIAVGAEGTEQPGLLGAVVLEDPLRADARVAVAEAAATGARLILATGDHLETATTVAREIGLLSTGARAVLAGQRNDSPLEQLAVVARATHAQKASLVSELRARGAVVAMLGDGVNDAPAMRAADVAVAIGEDATDVAIEAAHVVITDGRLASLVAGIRAGRQAARGLRQAIVYLLTASFATIVFIAVAMTLNADLPLAPLQILWLNLVVHLFPALALATGHDRGSPESAHPTTELVAGQTWIEIGVRTVAAAAGALVLYAIACAADEPLATRQAVAFAGLGAGLVGESLLVGIRVPREQGARLRRLDIWLALALSLGLLALGLSVPGLQSLLSLDALGVGWLLGIGVGTLIALNLGQVGVFLARQLLVHGDDDAFA
jgi:Ca2+-transporting ATPase